MKLQDKYHATPNISENLMKDKNADEKKSSVIDIKKEGCFI
jgi:hypothetical protein